MCSPLHIRAPTRPLIFQCVTEPLVETGLVASVVLVPVSVVAQLVRVQRCSTATGDCADNRALRSTEESTKQSASAGTGCGR